jgi:hypothetical protein
MATPPGYPSPSSLPTLSNASPAASSRVAPSNRVAPGASTRISAVWPPDTSNAMCGYDGGGAAAGCSRNAAARWPARWFTPTSGAPIENASAFAVSTPTSSAPTRPGPAVTATASRSENAMFASAIARSMTGTIVATCWRDATSGTTPP